MKFNKWTLGLAAVGVVSLASAARANELNPTAVSGTTISGVVDVGIRQQLGDVRNTYNHYTRNSAGFFTPSYGIGNYVDGFSLNQVIISIEKAPEVDKPWAAGYRVDLNYGDVVASSDTPIRQAYVALNTPVGNGIDWKVGVMDGVTGYESSTLVNNPNITTSYGKSINPGTLVGAIGKYTLCDTVALKAGYVNRLENGFGASDNKRQAHSYVFGATLTAPESLGFLKGSTLNLATIQGFDNESTAVYSADLTLATPIAGVKFGFVFDAIQSAAAGQNADGNVVGVYATYQATEKLGFALRGEYVNAPDLDMGVYKRGEEVTATMSYNLWQNVVSRVELRWDHSENTTPFYRSGNANAFLVSASVAYKF